MKKSALLVKRPRLAPALALGHFVLGMALLFSGRALEAIAPLEYGLRLSPYDPQNFVWCNVLALARLFSGRAEAALEAAARALQVRPNWWTSLEVLVYCYAALEKWDEARRCSQPSMDRADDQRASQGEYLVC